jgi:hypothetical protein
MTWPFGLKATCAAFAAEPESGRLEFGIRTSVSSSVIRRAWIVLAPWFRT